MLPSLVLAASVMQQGASAELRAAHPVELVHELVNELRGEVAMGMLGHDLVLLDDLDGDGLREVALSHAPAMRRLLPVLGVLLGPSRVRVVSGGTLETLWAFDGKELDVDLDAMLARVGDLDGDGYADLLVAGYEVSLLGLVLSAKLDKGGKPFAARLVALSTRDGSVLGRVDLGEALVLSLEGLADLDGDGAPEWALAHESADSSPQDVAEIELFSAWRGLTPADRKRTRWRLALGPFSIESPSSRSKLRARSLPLERRLRLQAGQVVLGLEDVDGDGVPDFACGEPTCTIGGVERGAVNVFSGRTGALLWTVSGAEDERHLGTSLSRVGDHDGDGVLDLAATSRALAGPGGRAHILSGANGRALATMEGVRPGGPFESRALSTVGDLDGDGLPEIAFAVLEGSPQENWSPAPAQAARELGPQRLELRAGADLSLLATLEGRSAVRVGTEADGSALLLVADSFGGSDEMEGVVRLHRFRRR